MHKCVAFLRRVREERTKRGERVRRRGFERVEMKFRML